MQKRLISSMLLTLSIFMLSCDDDPVNETDVQFSSNGFFVLNEGVWGQSNASLSYYNPELSKLYDDIFAAANDGATLGDVGQSMVIQGDYGYIVVNNSHKIEVIRLSDLTRYQSLTLSAGFSPRSLAFVSDQKAYLTSLYTASVAILSVNNGRLSVTGAIPVGQNPEDVAIANGKAYVANSGFGSGRTVSVINTATDQVIKTIGVGDNPVHIQVDERGHVLALGWGRYNATPGKLMVIDPTTDVVIDSLVATGNITELALNRNGKGYFLSATGVVAFSTQTYDVVQSEVIRGIFYTLGVNPRSGEIVVGDAKDFNSRGAVSIYSAAGVLKTGPLTVGINPGAFIFGGN